MVKAPVVADLPELLFEEVCCDESLLMEHKASFADLMNLEHHLEHQQALSRFGFP